MLPAPLGDPQSSSTAAFGEPNRRTHTHVQQHTCSSTHHTRPTHACGAACTKTCGCAILNEDGPHPGARTACVQVSGSRVQAVGLGQLPVSGRGPVRARVHDRLGAVHGQAHPHHDPRLLLAHGAWGHACSGAVQRLRAACMVRGVTHVREGGGGCGCRRRGSSPCLCTAHPRRNVLLIPPARVVLIVAPCRCHTCGLVPRCTT